MMPHIVRPSVLIVVFSLAALPSPSSPQVSKPDSLHALRSEERIRVDGMLTESAWSQAQSVSNFTQRELHVGESASETTKVAVLFDDEYLYIGFWGYDRAPAELIRNKLARDFSFQSEDNFKVVIDTYNDDRTGFRFVTNPNGALADAVISGNGQQVNGDWDGVWTVATRVTEEGWFAEFAIPFSTLRFGPTPEAGWGINFERSIARKHESVLWQGWSRDRKLENVSQAGSLIGLPGLSSVKLLEGKPYGVAGWQHRPVVRGETVSDVGGDVNYLITPTAKLTATVNPDFGQIESDRAQINLTRFSISYPEKREFFLEGADFFQFTLNSGSRPFYSRRIGLTEDRRPQTVLGGARLLGKFGDATVGAMSLQTAKTDGTPSTNFTVLRWTQDVLEESTVGLVSVTKVQPGRVNTTYGADLRYSTSHLMDDKNFSAGGAFAQSYTSDAGVARGSAHRIFVSYPNDLVEFDATWNRAGGSFNPEAGFQQRTRYQEFYAELQINPRPGFVPWIHKAEIKPLDVNYYIDDDTKKMQSVFMEFRPIGFSTTSGEFMEFNIQRKAENIAQPFEIADEIVISPAEYWFTSYEIQANSFSGRTFFADASLGWGGFYDGTRTRADGSFTWNADKHLSLSADYGWDRISLPAGTFTVREVGGRANFAFGPSLFGSVFGQWNNEDHEALFNFRLNWIPKPGTDLFVIINQGADTWDSRWKSTGTTMATKLIWRLTF
jgi:hypothetical protein